MARLWGLEKVPMLTTRITRFLPASTASGNFCCSHATLTLNPTIDYINPHGSASCTTQGGNAGYKDGF
jgi:hypothetical protein